MEKILVTGGCGFVGANLVRKLLAAGLEVRVLDNLERGNRDYLDGLDVEIIVEDIRNPEGLEKAFAGSDKIVHLAAYGSVVESIQAPRSNFEINVEGTINVLLAAVKNDIGKLVFSSTGGALIGDATPPVNEKSLPKPISPYGAGKLCCEAYCHAFAKSYGINTICTRFANVYGPYSDHKGGVINQFFRRLTADEPLTIYGDGSSTRDYIHVSDLCDGISQALSTDRLQNEVVHLASGRETSLKELADIMIRISGKTGHPVNFEAKRTGEVERNFARFDYAREHLGFEPKYELSEGLAETWDWLKRKQW